MAVGGLLEMRMIEMGLTRLRLIIEFIIHHRHRVSIAHSTTTTATTTPIGTPMAMMGSSFRYRGQLRSNSGISKESHSRDFKHAGTIGEFRQCFKR
ncbi:unnamed protein product [Rodentolepis nana]|uniref:Secreted protein n=1 Tax=Rodentolepis nana TaxID=102285 RepID=A0A0R3T8U6_RODNA|nr:unnamed protein product [Rodentolepis nana]